MQPNTQEAPGYFVWQAPGKPFAIHLSLAVVDRLNAEVMRGFGAVPKRGAEVGGVLLGTIQTGEKTVVKIDDFTLVPCEYRRGPSFYLSESEQETLGAAANGDNELPAVGYFRSHTRDGATSLGAEDLDLIARYFPDVSQVALLVKPFSTKVSQAGFFVREDGAFPAETPLEFPFRRREMLGEEAPARRSMYERKPRNRDRRPEPEYESRGSSPQTQDYAPAYEPEYPEPPVYLDEFSDPPKPRSPWMWFALAFVFLALGALLGYQLSLSFSPARQAAQGAAAFALDLTAGRTGDSLSVRWNRDSAAVRAAERGVLEIEDGEFTKPVPLDAAHLKEGTVIYQNSSPMVRFRLVIFVGSKLNVSETVEWSQ